MSNLMLFAGANAILQDLKGAGLPAYLSDEASRAELAAYNADVPVGPSYPSLSIKGKVFTLHKDGESTRLMRSEDEVMQSIQITVLRANPNARVFYMKEYNEGDQGESARPDCYTNDGQAPAADARTPQSKKCAICPHAVWGTGQRGEGTACTVNTRLAIAAPELLAQGRAEPTLLRVPAGSRRNFSDFVQQVKRHGVPYFAAVVKVGFDPEAPAPKLTFKLQGYLNDAAFAEVRKLVDTPDVLDIVGLGEQRHADAAPAMPPKAAPAAQHPHVDEDGVIDMPIARAPAPAPARAPARAPAPVDEDDGVIDLPAAPAPAPAPKPRAARKTAAPAPAPAVATADDASDLMGDLDSLLAMPDD